MSGMQKLEEIKSQLDTLDEDILKLIDKKRELSKLISKSRYEEADIGFKCREYRDFNIKKVVYQGVEGAY